MNPNNWEDVKHAALAHTLELIANQTGWARGGSCDDEIADVYHERCETHIELSVDTLTFFVAHEEIYHLAPASSSKKALKAFQDHTLVHAARKLIDDVEQAENAESDKKRCARVLDAITPKPEIRLPYVEDANVDDLEPFGLWEYKTERRRWWQFWK